MGYKRDKCCQDPTKREKTRYYGCYNNKPKRDSSKSMIVVSRRRVDHIVRGEWFRNPTNSFCNGGRQHQPLLTIGWTVSDRVIGLPLQLWSQKVFREIEIYVVVGSNGGRNRIAKPS
ncbi:hypothetical protein H5410_043704 [Solanum commersonii]|uniref:Uncharacterized protein n=1 Tax=Solanum commersonii TaxID=4109 RepID=A0A9J5Y238_SOLCO|nr:hypothetical protein H5410_043704 [Solanum commersonii]